MCIYGVFGMIPDLQESFLLCCVGFLSDSRTLQNKQPKSQQVKLSQVNYDQQVNHSQAKISQLKEIQHNEM